MHFSFFFFPVLPTVHTKTELFKKGLYAGEILKRHLGGVTRTADNGAFRKR